MKIRNIFRILSLAVLGMTLQSCEDFLTEENPNSLTVDNFYTNYAHVEAGVAALYNAFKSTSNYASATEENLRADMAVQGNVSRSAFTNAAYMQNFNNAYDGASKKWASIYTGIFRANQLIEGIQKVRPMITNELQLENIQVFEAQAYFFRGLFHFWLSTTFNHGAVPYVTSVAQSESDYYNKIAPKEVVIESYRKDLQTSLDLGLPASYDEDFAGMATGWAAMAILGKSYLYEEDYEKARIYFKEIIDNGGFDLTENINDNFSALTEFNEESILEISYTAAHNTEFGEWSASTLYNTLGMAFAKTGWTSVVPPMWLVDEYEREYVDPLNPKNWVEMEFDEYKNVGDGTEAFTYQNDVIYKQGDVDYYQEYLDATGDTLYLQTYVYHQPQGMEDYDLNIYKRVIKVDPRTRNLMTSASATFKNPLYTKSLNDEAHKSLTSVDIKWEFGKPYRLKRFSPRASYSLALNTDEEVPYYERMANHITSFHNHETAYFRKHTNWETRDDEDNATPAKASEINFRLIRLADIYLLYAESLIEGGSREGGFNEALYYVNKVRERAGTMLLGSETNAMAEFAGQRTYQTELFEYYSSDPDLWASLSDKQKASYFPITSAQALMTHLQKVERPLELCIEGNAIRVVDLYRWGITKERFEELSKERYELWETNVLKPNANDNETTLVDETKVLTETPNWTKQYYAGTSLVGPNGKTTYADFEQAATNYNETVAFWFIPSTETMSNPQ